MSNENFDKLTEVLGKEKAEEMKKLTRNYDNYISGFKNKINSIINPLGLEVLTEVEFTNIKE